MARICLAASAILAAPAAFSADAGDTVISVGQQSLSASELRRRWSELPEAQREALGKTPREALQAYIDRFIVPDLLLAESVSESKTLSPERRKGLETAVLQQAMAQRIRREVEEKSPVTDADIKAYFEAHRELFDRPERLRIFRILVASETEAHDIIQKVHELTEFEAWRKLAREKSLDRATNLRGGELGFVAADGHSDIFELEVDPALYAAAAKVKDGELVKSPVREKDKFAVVWRRGHVAGEHAKLGAVSQLIRAQLREARAQKAYDELLAQLKSKYVRDFQPNRLDGIDFGQTPADRFQVGAASSPDASTR